MELVHRPLSTTEEQANVFLRAGTLQDVGDRVRIDTDVDVFEKVGRRVRSLRGAHEDNRQGQLHRTTEVNRLGLVPDRRRMAEQFA